jgi:hypothetical protein
MESAANSEPLPSASNEAESTELSNTPPPTTVPPPNNPWLQLFLEDRDCGLLAFHAMLKANQQANPLEEFKGLMQDLIQKHGESFTDEVGFLAAYQTVQELKTSSTTSPSQLEAAQTDLEWMFARCMNIIYKIGSFTLPAMHFVGSTSPRLMLEGQEFHGYNERFVKWLKFDF